MPTTGAIDRISCNCFFPSSFFLKFTCVAQHRPVELTDEQHTHESYPKGCQQVANVTGEAKRLTAVTTYQPVSSGAVSVSSHGPATACAAFATGSTGFVLAPVATGLSKKLISIFPGSGAKF